MSRSGSRARNRKAEPPAAVADGPKGGRPEFEATPAGPDSQEVDVTWLPKGTECEVLWMDVILHPELGIPCLGISLGNSAYALAPLQQVGPLLYQTLQRIQAATQSLQDVQDPVRIVGLDGQPLRSGN